MFYIRYLSALVITLASPTFLYAAPGDFDTSFGGGKGWVSTGFQGVSAAAGSDVVQQVDGKLVVAGSSNNGSNYDFALVRYNLDGSLDTTFNGTGQLSTAIGAGDDAANSVIQQADGKLVAAGSSYNGSNYEFALVRYSSDGLLDTTFNGTGKITTSIGTGDYIDDYAYSVIQQADGKLVVAGSSHNGIDYDFAVVRYNANGSLDTTFNGTGMRTTGVGTSYDFAHSVIQQADGKLVVAGYSSNDFALVRYNGDGTLDTTFNGSGKLTTNIYGDDKAYSVIQQADGKLVAAGNTYAFYQTTFAVVRYNANGTLDTTFNGSGKRTAAFGNSRAEAYSVIQQADGKLVAAGFNDNVNYDFALVRFNTNGTLDTTFNGTGQSTMAIGGGPDAISSVIQQADGKLAAAGYSYNGSSNGGFALVRYNADGTLDAGFGDDGETMTAFKYSIDAGQFVIRQPDGKLIVAGTSRGSYSTDFVLVRYNTDGSPDTTFNGTGQLIANSSVSTDMTHSVIQQTDGKLVVAGSSYNGSNSDFALVRYNTDGSLDTAFNGTGQLSTAIGANDDIANSVIQQTDGKLVVAGTSYSDTGDFALVRYNIDGSLDTTFNGTGKLTTDIATMGDVAQSVIQQTDGKLVVAGSSYSNDSSHDFTLVRYNSDGSLDTTFNGTGKLTTDILGSSDEAYSVIQQADGKLVAAGSSYNGDNYDVALVRYNTDGTLDTTFDGDGRLITTFGTDDDDTGQLLIRRANSLIQQADGKLVAACYSYNDSGDNYHGVLVRYNSDGSLDTTFNGTGQLNTAIGTGDDMAYSVIQQADGKLVMTGYAAGMPTGQEFVVARYESGQSDTDGDGVLDWLDTDNDNDGVPNVSDAFPLDVSESVDTDGDGVGDRSDNDTGDAARDRAGSAVAFAGDFNGDGYGDYIVGIPGFDVSTKQKDAGRAQVISGKNGSLLAFLNGTVAKDALGTAVAGDDDIDGDGFDDVVVGAPNAGATHAGTVTVIYGRADGDNRTTVATNGTLKKSLFGAALALGDVDGDSRADILIGAPKDNDTTRSPIVKAAGSVTAYTVADQGHPETLTALRAPFYGAVPKAYAGTAVAAGDLDGTGVAIIIGAPNDTVETVKSSGSVKAYLLNAITPIFSKSGTKGSQFGKAVVVGDIDQLGYADVLVGSPLDDADSKHKDTGSISVFSGIDGSELTPKKYGANLKASLGYRVAVGDVNGDGKADLIAGAWKDDKPTSNPKKPVKDAGSVSIWSGSDFMPITTLYGVATKDYFGSAVSAGDINSDGKADIIIGIPGFDVSTKIKDAGKVTVVSGAAL